MDAITLYLYVTVAFLLAGTVKGLVGLGLPTTSVGLMTLTLDARTAIALVLMPMFISNIWQFYRAGENRRAIRQYAPFVIVLFLGIAVTFLLTQSAPEQVVLLGLGIIFLLYVATSATKWAPVISDDQDRPAQIGAGAVAGVMGGLSGVWAPPIAVYLAARQSTKEEFVRATGLLLMVGSVPLLWGYAKAGYLSGQLFWLSVALLIPTFAGFTLGERLRHRLSETAFKRLMLAMFAIMGLNLIRRALF